MALDPLDLQLLILVAEPTASSAMFLVGYIKDTGLGRILGRMPVNNLSHYGYATQVSLPQAELDCWISTHYWIRPDPLLDDIALPLLDIEVPFGENILTRALQEINEG